MLLDTFTQASGLLSYKRREALAAAFNAAEEAFDGRLWYL